MSGESYGVTAASSVQSPPCQLPQIHGAKLAAVNPLGTAALAFLANVFFATLPGAGALPVVVGAPN